MPAFQRAAVSGTSGSLATCLAFVPNQLTPYSSVLATFTLPPDHARVAIVTPLVPGGSLAGILEWRNRHPPRRAAGNALQGLANGLSEDETRAVIKQVLDGLVYLHANGFLHVSGAEWGSRALFGASAHTSVARPESRQLAHPARWHDSARRLWCRWRCEPPPSTC